MGVVFKRLINNPSISYMIFKLSDSDSLRSLLARIFPYRSKSSSTTCGLFKTLCSELMASFIVLPASCSSTGFFRRRGTVGNGDNAVGSD